MFPGLNSLTGILRWCSLAALLAAGVSSASADTVKSESAKAGFTYTFTMKSGLAPWVTWMPVEKTDDGVRMTLPGRLDPNHMDGIGPLWLLAHLGVAAAGAPGYLDLNDAEISIRIRARDLDLKGGRIVFWLAGIVPKADTAKDYPWQETNWALTCCDLGPNLDAKWQTFRVKLNTDMSRWTYAGGNIMQLGDWGERFVEYPLPKLMNLFTGSIHLAVVGTSASNPPTGKIEIGEIRIRTRKPAIPLGFADIEQLVRQQAWESVRWHLGRLLPTDYAPVNYHYGRLLVRGIGGPQNYAQGVPYLQKAQSMPEARQELADLYFYGLGVPRDPARAVQLLESEGTRDDPESRYRLGLAYEAGIGAAKDNRRALQDFMYAAQRGNGHAMHELARKLLNDDPEQSYFWYRLSRDRLGRELVGAQVEMLDWNIARLRASLTPEQIVAQENLLKRWTPLQ